MLFNSHIFIIFIFVIYLLFEITNSWKAQKIVLLLASYVFYGWVNPLFPLILVVSTVINFFLAGRIVQSRDGSGKRLAMVISLVLNLGLLLVLKYGDFFLRNLEKIAGLLVSWPQSTNRPLDLLLPLGISFYTFSIVSYSIDLHRGDLRRRGSFQDVALYIAFFPKLISGPIVRAKEFMPQCEKKPALDPSLMSWGIFLCAWGFFKKMVIADNIAIFVDSVFIDPANANIWGSWLAAYGYAMQIYFDFSGYSDIAIGLALVFGFRFGDNFSKPYGAFGFGDFWRRWHISLSTWLRDYLYIPLGGSRLGKARTYANLMFTMLVCGLWHGAQWTFVVWGGIHGLYLCVERYIFTKLRVTPADVNNLPLFYRGLFCAFVFNLVCIAWVFFRANSIGDAALMIQTMFSVKGMSNLAMGHPFRAIMVTGVTILTVLCHFLNRSGNLGELVHRLPVWSQGVIAGSLIVSSVLFKGEGSRFIYFQF